MPKKSDFNSKSLQHILKLIRIKDRDTTFLFGGGGIFVFEIHLKWACFL